MKWLWLLFLLTAQPMVSAQSLDIKDWLSRPQTRLLVVEFYSTHCKPCMKAVPKWKALHEKYRSRGLRFLVVSADPGVCAQPDWTPDYSHCDDTGLLQSAWKVESLPAAFMWDWQGRPIVVRGHVDQVGREIEAYFNKVPRILVEDAVGVDGKVMSNGGAIRKLVRTELARLAKFELVAAESEEDALADARRSSHDIDAAEDDRCRLGQEVSGNSVLKASVVDHVRGKQLVLELLSLEKGCLLAASRAPVVGDDIDSAIVDSVSDLVRQLVHPVDPGAGLASTRTAPVEGGASLALSITPSGARYVVDGGVAAGDVETASGMNLVALPPGRHTVEVSKEGFVPTTEEFHLAEGQLKTLGITLSPRVATKREDGVGHLYVTSSPEKGAKIILDGADTGQKTNVTLRGVAAGEHSVLLRHSFYKDYVAKVTVPRDDIAELAATLEENYGGIAIDSQPSGADLYIDGVRVGKTPYRADRLLSKAYKVRAAVTLYHDAEEVLFVPAGGRTDRTLQLQPAFGRLHVVATADGDELKGAEVLLNRELVGSTPLTLNQVRSGPYVLTVRMGLYADDERQIRVKDGELLETTAHLDAEFGTLDIEVVPARSAIRLDGDELATGTLRMRVAAGEHLLEIPALDETYRPYKRDLVVGKKQVIKEKIVLERRTGQVFVFSTPAGAEVYVDGKRWRGKKDETPTKVGPLIVGEHLIRVVKHGYAPGERRLTIEDGDSEELEFDLSASATAKVKCIPDGATIFVDGKEVGKGQASVADLADGEHVVTCRMVGFEQATDCFSVKRGKEYDWELELERQPTLTVTCSPIFATVFVDGKVVGTGKATAGPLTPGRHTVTCTAAGYLDASDQVDLDVEEDDTLSLKLVSRASLTIESTLSGTTVYLDDRAIGEAPIIRRIVSEGEHQVRCERHGAISVEKELDASHGSTEYWRCNPDAAAYVALVEGVADDRLKLERTGEWDVAPFGHDIGSMLVSGIHPALLFLAQKGDAWEVDPVYYGTGGVAMFTSLFLFLGYVSDFEVPPAVTITGYSLGPAYLLGKHIVVGLYNAGVSGRRSRLQRRLKENERLIDEYSESSSAFRFVPSFGPTGDGFGLTLTVMPETVSW